MNNIRTFVSGGGGAILGGHAWYWNYSNDDAYTNYSGNQLLRDTGLYVSTNTVDTGAYTLGGGAFSHALCGLDGLASGSLSPTEELEAAAVATEAVGFVPWGDAYLATAEAAVVLSVR